MTLRQSRVLRGGTILFGNAQALRLVSERRPGIAHDRLSSVLARRFTIGKVHANEEVT
jgi:hypothetical protein